MNSRGDNLRSPTGEVRRSRKLPKLSTRLVCTSDQTSAEDEVLAKKTNNNDVGSAKHVHDPDGVGANGSVARHNNNNSGASSHHPRANNATRPRTLLDKLLATPFVDTFEPTHQLGPDTVLPTTSVWTCGRDGAVKLRLTDDGPASTHPVSLVTFFYQQAAKDPAGHALSVKRNRTWVHWTWKDYQEQVELAARGFVKLGLERFHSVAILGFNAPEWFIANFAAIFAGGASLGIYLTNSAAACEQILKNSEANIVVVDNDIQLQKILASRERLPHLKAIIQYLGEPDHPDVLSWTELLEIGRTVPEEALQRRIKDLAINQCCTLIYTSGTTGDAKGVMLSHDNLYYTSLYITENWELKQKMKYVSFLPLSHIAAQIADIYTAVHLTCHVYFAQPDALKGGLVDILKEVRPDVFFAVPRVYEKVGEKIMETVCQMSIVKKNLILWALRKVRRHTKNCLDGNPVVPSYGHFLADMLVQKIRQAVGLNCSEFFFCGGAQLAPKIQQFYLSLNTIVLECLGMSECSGPHIMNTKNNYCLGSVGKDTPFTETRLHHCDDQGHGEICLRGRHVFMGYLNDETKSMEAFDAQGWLHSGDIGCYNSDGFLFVTGRIKELLITAGGENIAPVPIEEKVKVQLPIVSHAVLIGDKRKFLSLLVTIKCEFDMETLTPTQTLTSASCNWCRSVGSNAKTVDDIVLKEDCHVMEAIQKGIDNVNRTAISNAQRIQKWTILPIDFSIPGGELGPSLKLKRSCVVKKYENVIEEFYRV